MFSCLTTSSAGDNQHVAAAVAGAVGITNFRAGLKPEDKLAYITQAAAAAAASGKRGGSGGQGLLMAGDGINDAPALAAAQVCYMYVASGICHSCPRMCMTVTCCHVALSPLDVAWSGDLAPI